MSDLSTLISSNLEAVQADIHRLATDSQRPTDSIQLLAVSKTKPVSDIVLAYESGHRNFGENYVQEGVEKIHALKQYTDLIWHFIGPLQSNKSRLVAENFDWMHSVDRFKIAKRLNEQRPVFKAPLNICIQVNIDKEESKAGVLPSELFDLIEQIQTLDKINVRGLMTIPFATEDKERKKQSFDAMNALFKACQQQFEGIDTLSMGMSADIDVAIACGSTQVRVGTAIFGKRT